MDLATELTRWNDFFIAAAGAAVVLFGLVFIGLSIHFERETVGPPIVGLAVGSATTLFYPVLVCLVMLFPPAQPWVPSVALAGIGLLALASTAAPFVDRELRRALGGVWPRWVDLLRFGVPLIGAILIVVDAIWLTTAPDPALYLLAVIVVLFIATGTQTAWNILLGRIRISR